MKKIKKYQKEEEKIHPYCSEDCLFGIVNLVSDNRNKNELSICNNLLPVSFKLY